MLTVCSRIATCRMLHLGMQIFDDISQVLLRCDICRMSHLGMQTFDDISQVLFRCDMRHADRTSHIHRSRWKNAKLAFGEYADVASFRYTSVTHTACTVRNKFTVNASVINVSHGIHHADTVDARGRCLNEECCLEKSCQFLHLADQPVWSSLSI